jgi:uncharacterized membrane protein
MNTRRFPRFAPALAVLAAGALLLGACRGRHCGWSATPEEKADRVVRHLAEELDLTGDQKARLEAIKSDVLARKADFRALHEGFRAGALAHLRGAALDTAALNRDLEGREAKLRELRGFLVGKLAEFHAVLEPAQREKLAARIESHAGPRR